MFLAHQLAPSPGWRHFLQVGILVVGYSSLWLWLEKYPGVLLDRASAEADSQAESPELQMLSQLSPRVQVHFYVYSDPVLIYTQPEHPTRNLSLNGHQHPAKAVPSLPEEAE
ncbi:MAG: hypothetical protein KJ077_30080 [Anaerolineae bacterium]|nr:hypothetical protein [Anaerolineae bacterium]